MNEKIKLLAEQADIGFYWDSPSIYAPVGEPPVEQALITPEELAKFAELIVRECAGLVDHVIMEDGTRRSDFIRKHFGVEE